MKKVTMFETSDGSVHKTEKLALDHEKTGIMKIAIEEFVEKVGHYDMSKEDVVYIIFENRKTLLNILNK